MHKVWNFVFALIPRGVLADDLASNPSFSFLYDIHIILNHSYKLIISALSLLSILSSKTSFTFRFFAPFTSTHLSSPLLTCVQLPSTLGLISIYIVSVVSSSSHLIFVYN